MPRPAPLLTAGSRAPRRAVRIPAAVQLAVQYLLEGAPGDDGAAPRQLGFVEAAKLAGMKPESMRRWLLEPAVRSLVKARRAAVLESICAGNPLALVTIRDRPDGNDMAKVRAAVALEEMNVTADGSRPRSDTGEQRFQINIINRLDQSRPPVTVIDSHPIMPVVPHAYPTREPSPPIEPLPYVPDAPIPELQPREEDMNPIFKARRW